MGQILSSGCGSYTDLDSVTASADDVLEKKIIIDKDGDPVVGTMKNIGAYDTAVSVAANSTDLYLRMHNGNSVYGRWNLYSWCFSADDCLYR